MMKITRTQKEFVKIFEIKNLGKHHDLYVQSSTLLLADVLRTLEICDLNYYNFILQNLFQLLH